MLAHARPMTWSGRVRSGSGWVGLARNFVCNFRVGSGIFEFWVKYFGPYSTRHLVGSGIFRAGWSGLSGRVTRDFFFLEHAGELRIIVLIEEGWSHTERPHTHPHTPR